MGYAPTQEWGEFLEFANGLNDVKVKDLWHLREQLQLSKLNSRLRRLRLWPSVDLSRIALNGLSFGADSPTRRSSVSSWRSWFSMSRLSHRQRPIRLRKRSRLLLLQLGSWTPKLCCKQAGVLCPCFPWGGEGVGSASLPMEEHGKLFTLKVVLAGRVSRVTEKFTELKTVAKVGICNFDEGCPCFKCQA